MRHGHQGGTHRRTLDITTLGSASEGCRVTAYGPVPPSDTTAPRFYVTPRWHIWARRRRDYAQPRPAFSRVNSGSLLKE